MKKITMFFAFITSVAILQAQKIALHSSNSIQHFTGTAALSSAYSSAQNGDTIYLPGGSFTPPANFDKKLMIIGAGHYVDSTLATGKTFINGNIVLKENADGFYLEGVELTGSITFTNNESTSQVTIIRSKINSQINVLGDLTNPSSNFSLIGSVVLGNIDLANAQNVLISNSILQGVVINSIDNNINNNIILNGASGSSGTSAPLNGDNNKINNNVFIKGSYANLTNGNGNIAKNNLCVLSAPTFGSSSTVLDNYFGIAQVDIFTNQTGNLFNYTHDYHLQSPATYLGVVPDGSQVGIYGGTFPYKDGGVPSNPHIRAVNISNTTNASSEINVNISVGAQDN